VLFKKHHELTEEDLKQIERAREEIRQFERKYGMPSEEFFQKWQTGKNLSAVDDADANLWITHLLLIGKEED
jgi:hypothetical protein